MKKVYLFEINDVIANQMKLPYSTGLIWSHCLLNDEITKNYILDDWFYYRQEIPTILEKIKEPSVIGFNCFVWNWEYNNVLAKKIKEKYPECLIVFGGWQQPTADRSQEFFKKHSYVDILVHGEGEMAFEDILVENLKDSPDWKSITGCSVQDDSLETFVTEPRPRIASIDDMPSPYFNGLFDELIEDCPYVLETTIETSRGCPFQCTFCEIGTSYYNRVKKQSNEKVFKEIDWIAKNKVEFVYNADSTFGLFPEHLDVTKYFVNKKKSTGYPVGHRCDWAKGRADKVIELAQLFVGAKMDKGITIALQSMNPDVLKAVKRKNVDNGKIKDFLGMYNEQELPSYMELILGLPEETYDSFIGGVCEVMELGQHNYIGIYPLTALPNTPFGEKEYIEKYGLKIINSYTAFNHYDITEENEFEREDVVVESNTMTFEEYKKATLFRWVIMFAHYLGTMQYIARFTRKTKDISFKEFYERLISFIEREEGSFLNEELNITRKNIDGVLAVEQPWGRIVPEVKENFAWDFEEATAIKIVKNQKQFYTEVRRFLVEDIGYLEDDVLEDLLAYQAAAIIDPAVHYPLNKSYSNNIHQVIHKDKLLERKENTLSLTAQNYDGDYYKWGKEVLWWGRRIGACKTTIEEIQSI